jgi:hypothetical protein
MRPPRFQYHAIPGETESQFSLTRAALSTLAGEESKFCYETRQLGSLILFSFFWA